MYFLLHHNIGLKDAFNRIIVIYINAMALMALMAYMALMYRTYE